MTSLKDHQTAMVALLASGSAIPTSAARLAHAMHDVLAKLNNTAAAAVAHTERRSDSTTSGLNDALLSADVAAVTPKQPSERERVKQLENTVRQLRESNAKLKAERAALRTECGQLQQAIAKASAYQNEQSGCRKNDTQDDGWNEWGGGDCPVMGGVRVDVRFPDGEYARDAEACQFYWNHAGFAGDIVAYRVVKS